MTKKEIELSKIKRFGQIKKMNNNENAKIIKYESSKNIDVQFDDETIVYNATYCHFTNGSIKNPNYYKKFIGQKKLMNCSMECEIIEYNNCDNITVRFEDGTLKKSTYYKFLNKMIQNPNIRISQFGKVKKDWENKIVGSMKILEFSHFEETKGHNEFYYKCKCLKCNGTVIKSLKSINYNYKNNKDFSCGCDLSNKTSKLGKIIKDEFPYLFDFIANKEDINLPIKSNKLIKVKCPDCDFEVQIKVCKLTERGFICKNCGNIGISKSERILRELLKQLHINFKSQKTLDWSERKIYDFYIPSLKCIVETHGKQHYEEKWGSWVEGRTLKEEQSNDQLKECLAKENGIEHYISLDCRKSELEWIKNSILNSELNELFDLSEIDWNDIFKKSNKSMLDIICKTYNDLEIKSITEIVKKLDVSRNFIKEVLLIGNDMGLCNYKKDFNNLKYLDKIRKKVICIELNKIFNSETECSKYMKEILNENISVSIISDICNNKYKNKQKYNFEFIN